MNDLTEKSEAGKAALPECRYEFLKGFAIGLAALGLTAFSALGPSFFVVGILIAAVAVVSDIILFCMQRTRMAFGLLVVILGAPLLLVGACFGMLAWSGF